MARLDPDHFGERELARIFMTPKLAEARRAEEALSASGVDFFVMAEPFGRTLFGFTRTGASFYVPAEDVDRSVESLQAAHLTRGIVAPDDD